MSHSRASTRSSGLSAARLGSSRTHRPDSEAAPSKVVTLQTGLRIPTGLSFDEWELAGLRLAGIVNSSSWWLGDWLVYGKERYADRYQRGIATAGLQYQTLRNYAWVARRFPIHRRRAALSFQHHSEIASLPNEEQDMWLDQAELKSWTTRQLRNAVNAARQKLLPTPAAAASNSCPTLDLPGGDFDRWRQAAELSGTNLEQWVLSTLDHAAQRVLIEGEWTAVPSADSTSDRHGA